MSVADDKSSLNFADKAFIEYNEIMSNKHKNMIEDVNRANRGELFVLQYLLMHKHEVLPSELSAALHSSTAIRTFRYAGKKGTDCAQHRHKQPPQHSCHYYRCRTRTS